jgi:hypothetical protein
MIYYGYYLFYQKILKDNEPHLLATMAMGSSISFPMVTLVNYFSLLNNCEYLGKLQMFSIAIIILALVSLYFHGTGRAIRIVDKWKVYTVARAKLNIVSWSFFLFTASFLFWGPVILKKISSLYCN